MYSIHKSDRMNMLTFMRWWCWCGWEVWVIGWQKENWFSHDNLSLSIHGPALQIITLIIMMMRKEEEEILLKWKFEIEVETQDFIILFVWVISAVYLCFSFVFPKMVLW